MSRESICQRIDEREANPTNNPRADRARRLCLIDRLVMLEADDQGRAVPPLHEVEARDARSPHYAARQSLFEAIGQQWATMAPARWRLFVPPSAVCRWNSASIAERATIYAAAIVASVPSSPSSPASP